MSAKLCIVCANDSGQESTMGVHYFRSRNVSADGGDESKLWQALITGFGGWRFRTTLLVLSAIFWTPKRGEIYSPGELRHETRTTPCLRSNS
jgi:hypothetical protein